MCFWSVNIYSSTICPLPFSAILFKVKVWHKQNSFTSRLQPLHVPLSLILLSLTLGPRSVIIVCTFRCVFRSAYIKETSRYTQTKQMFLLQCVLSLSSLSKQTKQLKFHLSVISVTLWPVFTLDILYNDTNANTPILLSFYDAFMIVSVVL